MELLVEALRRNTVEAILGKHVARGAFPLTNRLVAELAAREQRWHRAQEMLQGENRSLSLELESQVSAVAALEDLMKDSEGYRDYAREVRRHREQARLFETR